MKNEEFETITKTLEIGMANDYEGYDGMSTLSCGVKRGLDVA